jgi:hypothetical protein
MAYGWLGGLAYGKMDGLVYGWLGGRARLAAVVDLAAGCPGQEIVGGYPMTRSKPKPSRVRRIG